MEDQTQGQQPPTTDGKTQAKSDVKDAAKAALKGAATGGWAGAAKNAAISLGKSKTGRKAIAITVAASLVPPALVGTVVGLSFAGANNQKEASMASQDNVIVSSVLADFGDEKEALQAIRSAASQYGVPWTILAGIYYVNMGKSSGEASTGFGIDVGKAEDVGWESDRSLSIDYAASFVAERISVYITSGEVNKNNVSSPFAGYEKKFNDDGSTRIEIGDTDEHKDAAKIAKESWVKDLEKLEIKSNPEMAGNAFDMAVKWFTAGQEKCAVTTDGGGGIISTVDGKAGKFAGSDMSAKQVGYAQAIIDTVAAEGMPEKAALIALITVQQESHFHMYWNSSVPGSKELTTEPDFEGGFDLGGGRKSLSVGLFQQQIFSDGTWGTVEDGMDPSRSTKNFLKALKRFDYESMEPGAAAQKVQGSRHPSRYSGHMPVAEALVAALPPGQGGYSSDHSHDAVIGTAATGGSPESLEGLLDGKFVTPVADKASGGEKIAESTSNPHNLKVDTSLKPDIQAVQAATVKYFADKVYAMGGYRAGSVGHSQRIASDLMVVDYKSDAGIAAGDKMSAFFIENKAQLGIDYIIWRDKIWLGEKSGWKEYSKGGYGKHLAARGWDDTTLHMDHLHVETLGNGAKGGDLALDGVEVGQSPGSESESAGCGQSGESILTGGKDGTGGVPTAGSDDYPFSMPGDVSWKAGSKDPGADPWGMYKRECVSFVAWRMNQQMGAGDWKRGDAQPKWPFSKANLGWSGTANAFNWGPNLTRMGYKMDMNPKKGSIAWYDSHSRHSNGMVYGQMGHVAVVLEVNEKEGTVLIEQYNGGTVASNPKKASYSTFTSKIGDVSGYIHVADVE